ncbi:uncharacterized protein TA11705 [Theileria annulata]|uniref:PH domain-containing protein n=1 Tax=Theileria annulata TaxID=5874 RepID=Q4UD90_THEAN|nr:uncharacterized protein TA11705 [Theileria annulata]CAI74949.1 hypothetical protein TA11705 [Theileria annulata]|eukprot:XP_952681.1 hypothetical protein TA11705 [Theileria annulata]
MCKEALWNIPMNDTLFHNSFNNCSSITNDGKNDHINRNFYCSSPSNQYNVNNFAFPNYLAPFYDQNIVKDSPSNYGFYSSSSLISSDCRLQLPNTGEYFNFPQSESELYDQIISNSVTDFDTIGDKTGSQVDSKDNFPGLYKEFLDEKKLFESLETKLKPLKLKEHSCETCSKNGYSSLYNTTFNTVNNLEGKNLDPCPHSDLKNVPIPYPITSFNNESTNINPPNADELDRLLSYTKETELDENMCVEIDDISEFIETQRNLNDLTPINTNTLRNLSLNSQLKGNLKNLQCANGENYTVFNEDLPVISLKNEITEDNLSKSDEWIYPKCILKNSISSQFPQNLATRTPFNSLADPLATKSSAKEEIHPVINLESKLLDGEMDLNFMIERYVELRKLDYPDEILRALKHMICERLNRPKLYYKGSKSDQTEKDTLEYIFNNIVKSINLVDTVRPYEKRIDEESTMYTYSSLSLSSYDSVFESFNFDVSFNDFFCQTVDSIHKNTVDLYGWLTVSEEKSRTLSNKVLYCELVGGNLSLFSASNRESNDSFNSYKLLKTVKLDEFSTITRKKDSKNNKIFIRLSGSLDPVNTRSNKSNKNHAGDMIILKLEADTQNELQNWYMFLFSRSRISSFLTILQDLKVSPLNNTLFFLLYPKKKELILNRLKYENECEEEIYSKFIKNHFYYADFTMRNMNDNDIIHHMLNWKQPVYTINFSLNKLNLKIEPQVVLDYLNNNNIRNLFLDRNPINESFYLNILPLLPTQSGLKHLSLKGCSLYPSIIGVLKGICKNKGFDKFLLDLRECELTPEIQAFLTTYPFNNLKIILQSSLKFPLEFEMDNFLDNKDLSLISIMGSVISGKLISTHQKVRKTNLGCFGAKMDHSSDVYFEYRAPYLVWYDWTPNNRRFSLYTRRYSDEQTTRLSEDKVMFVKNVKAVERAGTEWLMIEGKAPENFKYQSKLLKFYVRGVCGVQYTDYLVHHSNLIPSKYILSFCSKIDTPVLVMNEFPLERKFLMRFLSQLSTQSTLKVLNFSNMGLDSNKLSFEFPVLRDLVLEKLDYSFNTITLDDMNQWLLNALVPKVTVQYYNISNNPLGDSVNTTKFFLKVLSLKPEHISLNDCKLSNVFVNELSTELVRTKLKLNSLQIIEFEANSFNLQDMKKLIEVMSECFPRLTELRLSGSLDPEGASNLSQLFPICSFERVSPSEPEVGAFTRVSHVKKEKRTTRKFFHSIAQ